MSHVTNDVTHVGLGISTLMETEGRANVIVITSYFLLPVPSIQKIFFVISLFHAYTVTFSKKK